ncbi:MAG: hypothetical protein ACXWW0_10595 [Bacteroidia bacterium]
MKKWLIPVIVVLIILGAILFYFFNKKSEPKTLTKAEVLREIYRKAPKIDLPLILPDELQKYERYRIEGSDTILFPDDPYFSVYGVIGVLKDTSKYFTVIREIVGDDNYGFLITFDKKGKTISTEELILGGGSDCGYDYQRKETISPDLSINLYLKEESQECNEDGAFGPITFTETTGSGQINKNGKIIMKKPIVKKWVVQDSTEVSPLRTDSITTNSN